MRKKMLMELKPLKVMNRHIADAKKTEISLSPLEKQRGEPGKYRMYCRAAVEKGILKVYLFAVTDIEENINFPRYRLFISRKERRFITYDEKLKKWRKALLESILWDVRINLGNIYVNDCDTKVIQKYLKTMQPAIRALEEFQANIRKEQRIRHDKKLTDSWDQVMKTISGLPKNWIGWVSKYGITEHYIFYKYQKNGATEGYCTYCKKHVPIRSPKYNQKGQCNVCGQPITFRSVGKSGRFCTKWYRVYNGALRPHEDVAPRFLGSYAAREGENVLLCQFKGKCPAGLAFGAVGLIHHPIADGGEQSSVSGMIAE